MDGVGAVAAITALGISSLVGLIGWIKSRLKSGEIVIAARKGAEMAREIEVLNREVARLTDCLDCAQVERDAAQERAIEFQRQLIEHLNAAPAGAAIRRRRDE